MKMSNKTLLGVRGNGKPVTSFLKQFGQRNGKTLAGAMLEAAAETQVNPPATAEEAFAFCNLQIKRCMVNLANAKDRGDNRAAANLERKVAVYQFLKEQCAKAIFLNDTHACPPVAARECPNCRTHSVDIFGNCSCCGTNWGGVSP